MISFSNKVDLQELRERQRLMIDMLAINISVMQEKARMADGQFLPRVTYLCDCRETYFYPVLGARIENGVIEVKINATAPEWRPILEHELIVDSFDVVIYAGGDILSLSPEPFDDYLLQDAAN